MFYTYSTFYSSIISALIFVAAGVIPAGNSNNTRNAFPALAKRRRTIDGQCDPKMTVGEEIHFLLSEISYDSNVLPDKKGVNVTIEISVQHISEVSELSADCTLDLFFSEIWHDHRLNFEESALCRRNITLSPEVREKIWTPDSCIVNAKNTKVHFSPSENTFVILYRNGTVWVNHRMHVTVPCVIDLRSFPFDHQQCNMMIESYSYNIHEVRLFWMDVDPVSIRNKVHLPTFDLGKVDVGRAQLQYPNGNWDQLKLHFTFERRSGFYLTQAYFPALLTVLASWVTFFLDIRAVSARSTLGVSSLLALSFQFGTVLSHLPRVSYIKCIDVWMMTCVTFVFFSLAEVVIISRIGKERRIKFLHQGYHNMSQRIKGNSYLSRVTGFFQSPKNQAATRKQTQDLRGTPGKLRCNPSINGALRGGSNRLEEEQGLLMSAERIDYFCICAFPTVFLFFNVVYWLYYFM